VSSGGWVTPRASATRQCLAATDVLVIAGGLGTRIAPVLGNVPKLLAPISGRPYLAYLLDWLQRFGAERIVLALGHQAQAVIDFLNCNEAYHRDIAVVTVVEPQPLGTAGAIRFARRALRTDPVLIMNGDSFADADLCQFLQYHTAAQTKATLLCAEVDNAGRYGRVEIDPRGRIRRFVEKDPQFHGSGIVNAGIYLFSAALLDEIAESSASSLERDVFERAPDSSLGVMAGRFRFVDIGTPESLALAEHVIGNDVED
jgi:NDP-sugar pyrophosphorylase family protein